MNVKYFLSFSSPLFSPNPQFPIEKLLLYSMAGDICMYRVFDFHLFQ